MNDLRFFDIHTHTFPDRLAPLATHNLGSFYNFPIEGKGTADDLCGHCERSNVQGVLILLTATNPRHVRAVNAGGTDILNRFRMRGIDAHVFAGFHQDCPDPEGEFLYAVGCGLRGFKIHPDIQGCDIDDPRFFPLYRLCEGKYPVYFHMGDCRPQYRFSEVRKLLHVIEKFPDLRIGAAHLGGYTAWEDSYLLKGLPNVWFDTSSTIWHTGPEKASELIHMLGTDRCMFGTDYPVKTAGEEIKRFLSLELTDEERQAVAFGNAQKFLAQ